LSLLFSLIFSMDNNQLLSELRNERNWTLLEIRSDSINVYEKKIKGLKLRALKVEKVVAYNASSVLDIVLDINNYPTIMKNDDVQSFIVGQKNNNVYAYNYFPIPIPFIDDRHYLFKIQRLNDMELNWSLVGMSEVKKSSKLKSIIDKNSDAVYLNSGAGYWKINNLADNISKVSYILYMDSGGSLTATLNDYFASQSIIKLFKNILRESYKREFK
ncbi:hypothetical protein OAY83_00895, partial [Candidatus Marinimicrobia bacterium]|nr:hypothetical protein [Candidatus Neomarinimicrobiota bacterium]